MVGGLQLPLALSPSAESDFSAYLAGPNAEAVAALAAWPVIAALAPRRAGGLPDGLRQNAAGRAA